MPADADTNAPPAAPAATRPPPQIIRVPPPPDGAAKAWTAIGVVSALGIAAVLAFVFLPRGSGALIALVLLGVTVLLLTIAWRQAAARRARVARFLAEQPALETDPLACWLQSRWRSLSGPKLRPETLRTILEGAPGGPAEGARVVCLGTMPVPQIGDLRFEPYIITATQLLYRKLFFIPLLGIVAVIWGLQYTGLIAARHFNLSGFSYIIAMGVGALITWVWRTGIRPTYVRMAPGIIQVMEYRIGRRKPTIRSYPMETGTFVVLNRTPKVQNVTLLRGDQKDVLPIAQMRRREEVTEHLWRALLSTAPIPKLSDEELIE